MADRFRCSPDTAWVEGSDGGEPVPVAWVTLVPDGDPVILEGSAWLVWVAVAEAGTRGDTAEGIAALARRMSGGSVEVQEVWSFLAHLAEVGLVVRTA